jgi:hypothetical protein
MGMAMKERFFLVGLLLIVASSFFFSHFWSYAISVVQKTVALGILPLFLFAKVLLGLVGIHLLA